MLSFCFGSRITPEETFYWTTFPFYNDVMVNTFYYLIDLKHILVMKWQVEIIVKNHSFIFIVRKKVISMLYDLIHECVG